MTLNLGKVPANSVLYIPFETFNSNGASVTMSGLAVTDIEIYKDGSTTQRASDAGYALLDTDGIDFDGITGIHGFSINLADNTTPGFYAVGSQYWVVVSAVTVDAQTVNFIAATFRIGPAEASAGVDKVDVSHFGGAAGTFSGGRPEVNTTHWGGTAVASANVLIDNAITAAKIATDAITAAKIASGALTAAKFAAGAFDAVWSVATRLLTAGTNIVLAKGTGITGFNDLSAAQVNAEVDTALLDYDGPTHAELVSEINAVQADIAALNDPSAAEIADAVWEEPIADHSGTVGSTAEALAAAGSAGDPWATALPGAYGAGSAGFILGTNLDAAVSSRASQASVNTIDDLIDTEIATIVSAVAAIEADTQDIQARLPAALVGGRMDSSVGAVAANAITAASLAADAGTEIATAVWAATTRLLTAGTNIVLAKGTGVTGFNDLDAAGVRAAVGLAAANLDTQLAAIDDAVDTEIAAILAAVDTEVAAIKAKTDNLPASPAAVGDIPSAAAITAAILAGTITELSGVPSASPQLKEALAYLYMAVRNKRDTTAGADEIHNDAGAVIATASLSDDGTTFSKAKYA